MVIQQVAIVIFEFHLHRCYLQILHRHRQHSTHPDLLGSWHRVYQWHLEVHYHMTEKSYFFCN